MADPSMTRVFSNLRRAALLPDDDGLTDGQLLASFVARRDEAAFEALVRRHGPMVMGVCRRVLDHEHDAEDAFQATFLVLVRKATTLLPRHRLGNWLYGVAYYAALKARAAKLKRRTKETQAAFITPATAAGFDELFDLRSALDQELSRLPDKYREPVVLCELEGKSRKEVARLLGIPEGTLSSRLATARRRLAKRLSRYGLPAGAGPFTALLPAPASAVPAAELVRATVRAAGLLAAGAGGVSARVTALTNGVIRMMLVSKLKLTGAVLLVSGLVCAYGATLVHRIPPEAQATTGPVATSSARDSRPHGALPRYDQLWVDLASQDQTTATRAALVLSTTPRETLALFRERLRPVHKADARHIGRLLSELESAETAPRERATEELEYLGQYARHALEKARDARLAHGARRCVERLLLRLEPGGPILAAAVPAAGSGQRRAPGRAAAVRASVGPRASTRLKAGSPNEVLPGDGHESGLAPGAPALWLRAARATAVLEHIATPEAQKILQVVADGEPDAMPTRAAKAALKRLAEAPPSP
jgi:RNA polymerase sigma factor (sigma-70 family)